jgi:hypothetical protein
MRVEKLSLHVALAADLEATQEEKVLASLREME